MEITVIMEDTKKWWEPKPTNNTSLWLRRTDTVPINDIKLSYGMFHGV